MEERRDEWRGWRFVGISLAVTTASIIFFFAGRQFLPKIRENAQYALGVMAQRVNEWGGVRLNSIELQFVSEKTGSERQAFEPLIQKLKNDLASFEGSSFWGLDLSLVKSQALKAGWVKSVYLRRSFPDRLLIQIVPKQPSLIVRSLKRWVAVDEEGTPVWISEQILGAWINLPVVYGLEDIFERGRDIETLSRQTAEVRSTLSDAVLLVHDLQQKVGVAIESLEIKDDPWTQAGLIKVKFSSPADVPTNTSSVGKPTTALSKNKVSEVTFLSQNWRARLPALQFILSDLSTKDIQSARILGQFDGRWIVQSEESDKAVERELPKNKVTRTQSKAQKYRSKQSTRSGSKKVKQKEVKNGKKLSHTR